MDTSDEDRLSSERIQTSLLAGVEKRALIWIAERLPRWVTPDLLTFIGLAAMAWIGVAYYLADQGWIWLVGASVGLAVNWFGDSLDGTVARVRNIQRPKYGYYLDHLVDAFGTSFMLFGLAYSGLATPPLCLAVLALYLIMSINVYLATHTVGVFKISFARLGPTEGRLFLIVLNTVLIFVTEVSIRTMRFRILDIVAALAAVLLLVLTLRSAFVCLRDLNRIETAARKQRNED